LHKPSRNSLGVVDFGPAALPAPITWHVYIVNDSDSKGSAEDGVIPRIFHLVDVQALTPEF
jgi:hypothetical protein